MDTSNSAQASSQTALDLVLNGPIRINVRSLPPSSWLAIVRHLTELVRPSLKYALGWRTLSDIVQLPNPEALHHRYWDGPIESGSGVEANDRCWFIVELRYEPTGGLNYRQQMILLRQDGELLLVECGLQDGHYGYSMQSVTTDVLSDEHLTKIIAERHEYQHWIGYGIARGIHQVTIETFEARRRYLERAENLQNEVNAIMKRVHF